MQKLGQHFLRNKSALHLIVDALDLKPGEIVIEIGPGHGELTILVEENTDQKQWIAIEKDAALAKQLKEKFKENPQIRIVEGDALKILKDVPSLFPPASSFKIAGNIPYYITGHLFRLISELEQKPEKCVFTIQKEVAERITAKPPRMNRLAASVQFWAVPKIIKTLKAEDFSPPPKVDSAIIALEVGERKARTEEPRYYAAVRTVFAQPRKTILNNLKDGIKTKKSAVEISGILEKIGISPSRRPQDLDIADIAKIADAFFG